MRMTGLGSIATMIREIRARQVVQNGGGSTYRAGSGVVQPVPQAATPSATGITPSTYVPTGITQLNPARPPSAGQQQAPATIRVSPTASVIGAGGGVGTPTGESIVGTEIPAPKTGASLIPLSLIAWLLFS